MHDRGREEQVEDGLRDREVDRPELRDLDPRVEQELLGGVGLRRARPPAPAPAAASASASGAREPGEAANHARSPARLALGLGPGQAAREAVDRVEHGEQDGSMDGAVGAPRCARPRTSAMIVPHARVRNATPATATAGVGGRSRTKRLTPAWIRRWTVHMPGAQEPRAAAPARPLEERVGDEQHGPGHVAQREQPVRARRAFGRGGHLLGHRAHRVTVDGTTAPTQDRTRAPRRPRLRRAPAAAARPAASRSARRVRRSPGSR